MTYEQICYVASLLNINERNVTRLVREDRLGTTKVIVRKSYINSGTYILEQSGIVLVSGIETEEAANKFVRLLQETEVLFS